MMTRALRVRTTKVSMNTPIMATTPCSWGLFDVGQRVGVRRGAHTGLIGEQAALSALGDGDLQRRAEAAADDGLRGKGIPEDHAEGRGDVLDAGDEDDQAAGQENRPP